MEKKLIPYNLYLHAEHVDMLKKMAEDRKASSLIREAISMRLDGNSEYLSGYNRALKDAIDIIHKCKEIQYISIRNKSLSEVLEGRIHKLEKSK